jgi:hypothetical protein
LIYHREAHHIWSAILRFRRAWFALRFTGWLDDGNRDTLPGNHTDQIRTSEGSSVRNRLTFLAVAAVAILMLSPAARSQAAAQPGAVPDISGVWLVENFQPRLFPNGGAPFKPWAEMRFKATNPQTNDPNLGCLPMGLPRFMLAAPYPMEIFQVPSRVIIIHEGPQMMRQIYMNRQHPKDLDPTYSGDSVGKWEGDTLVVDTIGFNDKTWLDGGGLPHSETMRLVERIRRVDHDTLVDDITIDDPQAYTKPLTSRQVYKLKTGWEIQEYVCEENNKYTYQEK